MSNNGTACRDKFGQEIIPGCIIAYPYSLSDHSVGIRIGRIVKVQCKNHKICWGVSEEYWSVAVRGIDEDYHGCKDYNPPLKVREKAGILYYPERVIVLNDGVVPLDYLQLLRSIPIQGGTDEQ